MKVLYHFNYKDNTYVFDAESNEIFEINLLSLKILAFYFNIKPKSVNDLEVKFDTDICGRLTNLDLKTNSQENSDFYEGTGWTYGDTVDFDANRFSRDVAVVITEDGSIYENDINHQECFLNIRRDFFEKYNIDILETSDEAYDYELEQAIEVTNNLFQTNEYYGFDVFNSFATGESYFVAHYPQNLDKCLEVAYNYACANDLELATFTSTTNLSRHGKEVIVVDKNLI